MPRLNLRQMLGVTQTGVVAWISCFVVALAVAQPAGAQQGASSKLTTRCEKAFDEAQDAEKVVAICRQDLMVPLRQEQRMAVLETMGKVFSSQGEYDLASSSWQEAAQYRPPVRGNAKSIEDWCRFQVLIGQNFMQANQPTRAEQVFKAALVKAESLAGPYSLPAGMVQDALGTHFALSGRADLATKAFERARIVHEIRLGKNHLRTVETRLNQAIGFLDMGRENEAKVHLEALAQLVNPLPEFQNTPVRAEILTFLGTLQMRDEELQLAIQSYEQALNVRQKVFGANDVRTSQSFNNLGVVYYRAGQFKQAEVMLSKAYIIRKDKLGEQDGLTQSTQKNLQAVIEAQQQTPKPAAARK